MSKSIAIVILLISILVIGVFLIWPKYQDLRSLQLEIGKKTAELQYKEKHISNLQEVSEELEKYKPELSKIDSILPFNPSLPSLFNFLQKASSQNGLIFRNVDSFSMTTPKEKPGIKEISLNLGVSGSYSAFRNFLSTLEKSARLIEIENISFSSPEEKPTVPTQETPFDFDLRIKVYSY
ncbi:MAG: type 4a pilus biogenesis protein PilO [Candidatus Nealsonbacteria bacterium]